MSTPAYYPIFLNLSGRRVLVVGGGEVALRKVEALAAAEAHVLVAAPAIDERIARTGGVECRTQGYDAALLEGATLAVAATDDAAVNSRVATDCRARGILCNVVDVPAECDFIVPSVFRQGPLTVAVSTGGASPAAAARLRRRLEEAVGPEVGLWIEALGRARDELKQHVADATLRHKAALRLVEDDVLEAARRGREALERKIADVLSSLGLGPDGDKRS